MKLPRQYALLPKTVHGDSVIYPSLTGCGIYRIYSSSAGGGIYSSQPSPCAYNSNQNSPNSTQRARKKRKRNQLLIFSTFGTPQCPDYRYSFLRAQATMSCMTGSPLRSGHPRNSRLARRGFIHAGGRGFIVFAVLADNFFAGLVRS